MSTPNFDLAIVGGGVIGLTLAWRAALEGMRVAICERGQVGQESSWAGAGILPAGATQPTADAIENLRGRSHPLHARWSEELRIATGIDNGYRKCGGVYVARSMGERATLLAQQSWWDSLGIQYHAWDSHELRKQIPHISSGEAQAWYVPEDAQLRNPHHLRALRIACDQLAVDIREESPVVDWVLEDSRVRALVTTQGLIQAKDICIASGAWSGLLAEKFEIQLDIYPVRGQMVLYRQPRATIQQIVHDGNRYLVPREDGRVLAGSCEEEVGFQRETTEPMIQQLHSWASGLMPSLKASMIEKTWAGLRPGTVDGLPYLGKVPHWDNVYVASGHFRHGLHWSTATAEIMLGMLKGATSASDLSPFALQRGQASQPHERRSSW